MRMYAIITDQDYAWLVLDDFTNLCALEASNDAYAYRAR